RGSAGGDPGGDAGQGDRAHGHRLGHGGPLRAHVPGGQDRGGGGCGPEGRCGMSNLAGRVLLADESTVEAIACAIDPRFRALVLLLRYTALRWNEAVALRRRRCFVREGSIEVAEQVMETRSGPRFRSLSRECGWVSVRDGVKDALPEHLARYVAERPTA